MNTKKQLDWTKPIQTREGNPARLLGVYNSTNEFNHVVAVRDHTGHETSYKVTKWGSYYGGGTQCEENILNVPPKMKKIEGFVNIYRGGTYRGASRDFKPGTGLFHTESEAQAEGLDRGDYYITTIPVSFEIPA